MHLAMLIATECPLQAWMYQPWVQEAINKRLNKLADVTQPTIGFHVRGGDKLAEDKMLVGRFPPRQAHMHRTGSVLPSNLYGDCSPSSE